MASNRCAVQRSGLRRFESFKAASGAAPSAAADDKWLGAVVACALLLRHAVSLSPYSGEGTPPRFGDYEAHRHWMEVTTSVPLAEWYSYDTDYWGLDYPPLMAYLERILGAASVRFDPASVALGASRGYETREHRAFMRGTVLALDAAVCVSAFVALSRRLHGARPGAAAAAALALLAPPLLLVDHGHFQYNCVPVGLALWAVYAIDAGRPLIGAALFCLALNSKQTALYFAPAIFFELLARCCLAPQTAGSAPQRASAAAFVGRVAALGAVVITTFAAVWAPLISAGAAPAALRRCFPFERGVFEDKVANAWYAAQVFLRVRDRLPREALVAGAALATLVGACGPCAARGWLVAARRTPPTLRGLLASLHVSALAFFLASYHVHEKAILVPLAPLALLHAYHPRYVETFTVAATVSLAPLACFEGQRLAYAATLGLYIAAAASLAPQARCASARRAAVVLLTALHAVAAGVTPPQCFPDIYPALTALACAACFSLAWLLACVKLALFYPACADARAKAE